MARVDGRRRTALVALVVVLLAALLVAGSRRSSPDPTSGGASDAAASGTVRDAGAAPAVDEHLTQGPCRAGPAPKLEPGPVLRTVAAAAPVVDSQDASWVPSDGWRGGHVVTREQDVTKTGSPELYRDVRVGVEALHLEVPGPGTYAVDVAAADDAVTAPGQRVFDVVANDVTVASALDIVAAVGPDVPHHLVFSVAVAGRCLDLRFVPVVGEPIAAAVAVGYLGPALEETVTWGDEFDGPAGAPVDAHRWQHETGGGGWGNQELQAYTDDPSSSHLDGEGNLRIVARRTGTKGGAGYQSARLITKDRMAFRYGHVVLRAQAPVGRGLWPAFWALGDDIDTVGFPRSGEIDIMEATGAQNRVLGHLHGADGAGGTFSLGRPLSTDVSRMADYELLWTPVGIRLSVDGQAFVAAAPSDLPRGTAWPFDKRFYLLLNLAVGGSLPGPPDATTPFPAELVVDHVRVATW